MGTPDFAAHSLKILHENNIEIKAVITAPDKPAGRGRKIKMSAVKEYASDQKLRILQPINLKEESFIQELKSLNADLFVVVAFRMLPEIVWNMPELGTINLHGSILPNYRGAAPINWAVINGEKTTGVTTFFIEKEIDTGKVINIEKIEISETDNAGSIHDKLKLIGGNLMLKTVNQIFEGNTKAIPQSELVEDELKDAPKIFKSDCKIDWNKPSNEIYNKIRGLSPYPASFTTISNENNMKSVKLFKVNKTELKSKPFEIQINDSILFGTKDYFIEIEELQLEGKKKMKTNDFLRGFNLKDWKLI